METKKTTESVFNDFTNLYSLQKTLRFELKPMGKMVDYVDEKTGEIKQVTMTEKMILENGVFEKDETVAKNYQEAKKWFDKLHQEFINDTLSNMRLSHELLTRYNDAHVNFKNNKDAKKKSTLKKNIDDASKRLRSEILLNFEKNAEKWRDKYVATLDNDNEKKKVQKLKKLEFLFKAEIFNFLKKKYPEAIIDKKSIFDSFNKFSTYFTGFHQTRQNFYKDDGTSTAIPTRIIDDNFPKFLDNRIAFEKKYFRKCDELFLDNEKEIFSLEYFNDCFTQEQIEKYNSIVSILRSKINEKRQKISNKNDLPFFKALFKQILSERTLQETDQSSFMEIVNDKEVFDVLKKFINENERQLPQAKELFDIFINDQLADTKDENKNFNIAQIYISGGVINTISNKWFADWNTIRSLFLEKDKKLPDFVSFQKIREKIRGIENDKERTDFFRAGYKNLYEKENDYYNIFLMIWQKEFITSFEKYKKSLDDVQRMIRDDGKYTNKKEFLLNDDGEKIEREIQKDIIRTYAENALSIYQMMKYFALESGKERNWNINKLDEDGAFYNPFIAYYQNANTWKYFNVFRNYLTQKAYREDKIKLNFESGNLLGGWPDSPEGNTQYKSFIFRKNNKYFLGITDYSRILDKIRFPEAYGPCDDIYEKMIYKQLDGKTIYGSLYGGEFGTKYTDDKEILSDNELMNRVRVILEKRASSFPQLQGIIDRIKNSQYDDPKKIATDIQKLNLYSISFVNVSASYLEQGEYRIGDNLKHLYLFEIYNKDFAEKSDGNKNLHTLYWNEIFSNENLENPIIKLNGQAEIFFRKASLKKEIDKKRNAPRKIIKSKRYTENKIFFHCPLTLNFTKDELKKNKEKYKGKADAFSIKVREYLANNKDVNIIGIDRGEKHLAYYSVVNQGGEIINTESLNKINGKDYHKILDDLEKDREQARLTWQAIGQIKEIKRGYVSQVVKKICDLMMKYNAIVVFEDLNIGFKRGRFAIEKQIYQNLELALARKLNYLVFKDKIRGKDGHYAKALQLTPQIANFKDIYKQCGFMFYIPASYTSAMCPMCGFRKNIPTPTENKEKNKEYIKKFDIMYEKENNRFRFSYALKNVIDEKNKKEKSDGFRLFEDTISKDNFIFYSNVERLQFQRNKNDRGGKMVWKYPNEELMKIFAINKINIKDNINKQIHDGDFEDKNLYAPIIHNIRLILQLRNAITKKDENRKVIESHDFVSCPSCGFHSEKNVAELQKRYIGKEKFEFNGDANGAYNIARKGGLVLMKIAHFTADVSMMQNQDLTITQKEWDKYAMKH